MWLRHSLRDEAKDALPSTRRTAFVVRTRSRSYCKSCSETSKKRNRSCGHCSGFEASLASGQTLAGAFFGAYFLPHNLVLVNRSIRACVNASTNIIHNYIWVVLSIRVDKQQKCSAHQLQISKVQASRKAEITTPFVAPCCKMAACPASAYCRKLASGIVFTIR